MKQADKELLEMLRVSTNQLNKTIEDLTNVLLVKNNPGNDRLSIHLPELFQRVENSIYNALLECGGRITTDFQVPEVQFNPVYLESIMVNLISNSIKYRSRERSLRINIRSFKDENGDVKLTISDNGTGIDLKMHKDKVFGLYQRFHDNVNGQGLGLFMIKSQVNALGGKIGVESEVDKETTFTITMPGSDKAAIFQIRKENMDIRRVV
jgi:signal transduction histidine kinase